MQLTRSKSFVWNANFSKLKEKPNIKDMLITIIKTIVNKYYITGFKIYVSVTHKQLNNIQIKI